MNPNPQTNGRLPPGPGEGRQQPDGAIPARPRSPRVTNRQLEAALRTSFGLLVMASRRAGCPFDVARRRVGKSRRLASVIEEYRLELVELAILYLRSKVTAEPWAATLVLKAELGNHTLGADLTESGASPVANPGSPLPTDPLIQDLLQQVMNDEEFLEFCRQREGGGDAGGVREIRQPGTLEAGPSPGGDRPGPGRDHSGEITPVPGD